MIQNLFQQPFLSNFLIDYNLLPFTNNELKNFDEELNKYENFFLDPQLEKTLISKSEFLASFAISKAENSSLTVAEAQEVYQQISQNPDYQFVLKKILNNKPATIRDYEKAEFINIVKTVRKYNQNLPKLETINIEFIKNLHYQLTQGLDFFESYVNDFTVYRSGELRNNDTIRVGEYVPAPYNQIESNLLELLNWLKNDLTPTNVGVFHTAFYAIHPFTNGNKRTARVLEHILLQLSGTNKKAFYSTSYYYHQEKARYYKYLLSSLQKKNFNYFVSFFQEAIVISIGTVIQSSLEVQRSKFIKSQDPSMQIKLILQQLVKRRELQFGALYKLLRKKMARQTFVNYLQQATENGLLLKRGAGRATYYKLNVNFKEEDILDTFLQKAQLKLSHIPTSLKLS